ALPGNSAAMDLTGSTTSWFRSRSNVTSYGTHNVFSGGEYTTSGATPFQAGILAMVQSAGLNLRDSGRLPGFDRLTPNEIKQVLMDTAQPIIPNALPPQRLGPAAPPGTKQPQWPGNPNSATDATHTNWSTQYGYGRPDVGAATAMVMAGKIPPTADIIAPQWYSYIDPTVTPKLEVDGSLARSRFNSGGSVSYVLEWALGADPADGDFHTVAGGTVGPGISGKLGSIELSRLQPDAEAARPAQPRELPRASLSERKPGERARPALGWRRGGRPVPQRRAGDRGHQHQRRGLRLGQPRALAARLPGGPGPRQLGALHGGADASRHHRPQPKPGPGQLVTARAGRPRGERPARHPDDGLRRLRLRVPSGR